MINVPGDKCEWLVAWIVPLTHETVGFVGAGARSLCLRLPVNGVRAGSRNDVLKSHSRPMVWCVGRHPSRENDLRQVEIIRAWVLDQLSDVALGRAVFVDEGIELVSEAFRVNPAQAVQAGVTLRAEMPSASALTAEIGDMRTNQQILNHEADVQASYRSGTATLQRAGHRYGGVTNSAEFA
jgi:hypothetical protein